MNTTATTTTTDMNTSKTTALNTLNITPILINHLIKINNVDDSKTASVYDEIISALSVKKVEATVVNVDVDVNEKEDAEVNRIIKNINNHPSTYVDITPFVKNEKQMLAIISIHPNFIMQAHHSLLTNKDFMGKAVKANPLVLMCQVKIYKDIEFIASLVEANPKLMSYVPKEHCINDDFMLRMIITHPQLVRCLGIERQNNPVFIRKALTANASIIEHMTLTEETNEFACIIASKIDIKWLKMLSDKNKNDHDKMISMALSVGRGAINYASRELLEDTNFIAEAIGHFGNNVFVDLPINYKTNHLIIQLVQRNICLYALERGTRTFTYEDIIKAISL